MQTLNHLVKRLIQLRESGQRQMTLLAVCPNSAVVLEAAVKAASLYNAPMLFAATLNQVDTDGGYTGWTPVEFVRQMHAYARRYAWSGPLYPCLDHGGPWLKDQHTRDHLSLSESMGRVEESLTVCLEAGYQLLHIDPTVDRSLPVGEAVPIEMVVERTVELITHAEQVRRRLDLPQIAYEVGTEEVHGGLTAKEQIEHFSSLLRQALLDTGLADIWPCFIVAQVGTDLHTTTFDAQAARQLYDLFTPLGSLAKGHYTDWVENPADYPATGMGGANVGPEFTAAEYQALKALAIQEDLLIPKGAALQSSGFMRTLRTAVIDSGRWQKWLLADENGREFEQLSPERQDWLLQTGSRYTWTAPPVVEARQQLYGNLATRMPDPHRFVVDHVMQAIEKYLIQFNLVNALDIL